MCALSDCRGPHFSSHTRTPSRLSHCARSRVCACVCVLTAAHARQDGAVHPLRRGAEEKRRGTFTHSHRIGSFSRRGCSEDAAAFPEVTRLHKLSSDTIFFIIIFLMNRARPEHAITSGLLRDSRDVRYLWVPAAAASSG